MRKLKMAIGLLAVAAAGGLMAIALVYILSYLFKGLYSGIMPGITTSLAGILMFLVNVIAFPCMTYDFYQKYWIREDNSNKFLNALFLLFTISLLIQFVISFLLALYEHQDSGGGGFI